MSLVRDNGRLRIRTARVDFTFASFSDAGVTIGSVNAGHVVTCFQMPAGSIVIGGEVVITTAFTTTDTSTIAVGDVTTADRYLAATDIEVAARTALVPTGFVITTTQPTIQFTMAVVTSANTAGAGYLRIEYTVQSRRTIRSGREF